MARRPGAPVGLSRGTASHIITGAATKGSGGRHPEPYRTAGIDVLPDRGLITATAHGFRPSDEVTFSLRLGRWQY